MGKTVVIPVEILLASLVNFTKAHPTEFGHWQTIINVYPPKLYMRITGLTKGQWQRYKSTGTMRGSKKKLKIITIWANPHYHALYKAYLAKNEPS